MGKSEVPTQAIRFRELTKEQGLKAKLSKAIGEPMGTINQWKDRSVSGKKAQAVADFLGCHPSEISVSWTVIMGDAKEQDAAPQRSGMEPQQPPAATPTYIDQLRQAAIALINTADAAKLVQIMAMAIPGAQIATANQQAPPNGSIMDVVESHAIDEEKFFSAIRNVVRDEVKSVIVDLDEKREERRTKDLGRSPTGQMRRKTDKKQ